MRKRNTHHPAIVTAGISTALLSAPLLAFASNKTLSDLIATAAGYLNKALALLMGFAVLCFVWFVIKYFIRSGDSKERAEGASYVMWSVIGFFVVFSMWGLVNILISTFDLGTTSPGSWTNLTNLFPH